MIHALSVVSWLVLSHFELVCRLGRNHHHSVSTTYIRLWYIYGVSVCHDLISDPASGPNTLLPIVVISRDVPRMV